MLIQRHGQPVYFKCFGKRDVDTGTPMTPDAIFPIHSVTKTITSVAAMMLVDRGKIALDDPVSKYIPSFANMKVGVERKDESGKPVLDLVPPRRPITIEDLLLHTSGITYGFYGDGLVKAAYDGIYLGDFDNAEFAERIAKVPLAEQPRTLWDYGHSTDILGRVIEVASGQSLYQFEKQNLLDPLGMTSTKFFLTDPAERARYAQPLPRTGTSSAIRLTSRDGNPAAAAWSRPSPISPATGRCCSTAARSTARPISVPATFKAMTTDHIGPGSGVARNYFYYPGDGFGFGYGFGVRTDPGNAVPPPPGSLGEIKWDGATGVYIVVDRAEDMFFVVMQDSPSGRMHVITSIKKIIYDAFETNDAAKTRRADQVMTAPARIIALDRARTFITLLVLLHHSVVNYTYFGSGDRMRWLGFDLVVLFNDSFFMACMFLISGPVRPRQPGAQGGRGLTWAIAPGGWACRSWSRSSC